MNKMWFLLEYVGVLELSPAAHAKGTHRLCSCLPLYSYHGNSVGLSDVLKNFSLSNSGFKGRETRLGRTTFHANQCFEIPKSLHRLTVLREELEQPPLQTNRTLFLPPEYYIVKSFKQLPLQYLQTSIVV